jgi:hypothetical protein
MAVIKANFGEGGANLAPRGAAGKPTLAEALRDAADDFAGLKVAALAADASTNITTADADATYGQPEADLLNELKADVNALRATVLDLRAKLAAVNAYTIKTTKG